MVGRCQQLHRVQTEAAAIFAAKNKDYGDAFARYGPVGVIMRMNDKVSRLVNITRSAVCLSVRDETLRDTLMDLHNYSAMAVMLLDEERNTDPPCATHGSAEDTQGHSKE